MCSQADCNHDDPLDDDLDAVFGPLTSITKEEYEAGRHIAETQKYRMHEDKCRKCGGSGRFVSYSGRVLGDCFTCKGKGVQYFRQSLEQREKAREQKARREEKKVESWIEEHSAEHEWMHRSAPRFDFARSMLEALAKYKSLTDNQLAAVRKCMVRDEERQAQWKAEREAKAASAPTIDISAIERALLTAKQAIDYPKIRLAAFVFSLAGAASKNAGSIYVKAEETYLGKITDGRFHASRDCTPELQAAIIAAAANPEDAARAYGLEFGICSCCGRKLTNKLSIELGIGPICRERYGWA